jgi:hypothetical protein
VGADSTIYHLRRVVQRVDRVAQVAAALLVGRVRPATGLTVTLTVTGLPHAPPAS